MKPTYIRRIRRKPAAAKDNPAFRKEGKETTFFGEATQDTFFQPAPVVQRKSEKGEEEEKKVQRKEDQKEEEKKVSRMEGTTPSAPAPVSTGTYLNSLHGKGQALPPQAQQFFGSRMGYDFSNVKIHTGTEAAQSAKEVNAQAYTYQNHIVFNEGKYNTESAEGKNLLAHELTHVQQQHTGQNGHAVNRKDERTFWFKDPAKQTKAPEGEIETSAETREKVFIEPTLTQAGNVSIRFAYPQSEMSTAPSANITAAKTKIAETIAKIIGNLGSLPASESKAAKIKLEQVRARLKEALRERTASTPLNIFIQTVPSAAEMLKGLVAAYTTRAFVNLADVGDEKKLEAVISAPLMMLLGGVMPSGKGGEKVAAASEEELKDTLLHESLHALLIKRAIDAEAIYQSQKSKRKMTGDAKAIENFEQLIILFTVAQEEAFVYDNVMALYPLAASTTKKADYDIFIKQVKEFIKKRSMKLTSLSKKIDVAEKVARKRVNWEILFEIPTGSAQLESKDNETIDFLKGTYPL